MNARSGRIFRLIGAGRLVGAATSIALSGAAMGCWNDPVGSLAVWSEFLPVAEVRDHLPTLARYEADLYLAVRADDLDDELAAFLTDARAAGVAVRPWLQLPDAGVWVNEDNAEAFAAFALAFLEWAATHGVLVEWLIFDLEPSFSYAEQLRTTSAEGGIGAALDLLTTHRDAERFEAARQALQELVDRLHTSGVRAMGVTLPWTIDDLADGDPDLQDLFDTPLAGIDWDQVSVMVYRPAFSDLLGVPLRPGYVARYAESMAQRFPGRAQVAIGNISTPGLLLPSGYTDPVEVALDVSAARSAGVDNVSLYSLDGMVLAGGTEVWLAAAAAPTVTFSYPDPMAALVRWVFAGLDRSQDTP